MYERRYHNQLFEGTQNEAEAPDRNRVGPARHSRDRDRLYGQGRGQGQGQQPARKGAPGTAQAVIVLRQHPVRKALQKQPNRRDRRM